MAQPPPPAKKEGDAVNVSQEHSLSNLSANEKFSSVDGRFTISLPKNISGFSALTPQLVGINASGSQYQWRVKEGIIIVNYLDLLDENINFKTEQDYTNYFAGAMDSLLSSLKAKSLNTSKITLENNKGIKLNFELPNGLKGTYRNYIVNKRQYTLTAAFAEGVSEAETLINRAFDSLKLISQSTIDDETRRKIEASTPPMLPQEPIAKKEKSDAEDDNLKGKVKTVTQESDDLSGTWSVQGRHMDSVEDFNERGNSIKRLSYDSKGLPFDITVFGYIDGARVRKSESIRYDSNPPLMAFSGSSKAQKNKPDLRYSFKHEYQYADGKLVEEKWIQNDGELWLRYVYKHIGNQVEFLVYSQDGKLNQKYLLTLDDRGNEIERINYNVLGIRKDGDEKYSIKYDLFDEQGNWTKKTTSKLIMENGKQISKPFYITYRTISYYQ